jgi:hypothetical protein
MIAAMVSWLPTAWADAIIRRVQSRWPTTAPASRRTVRRR